MKGSHLVFAFFLMVCMSFGQAFAGEVGPLDGKKIVITIKTADVTEAGMGIALANSAAKKGAKVTVVLGANAALYPVKDGGQNIFAAKKQTPRELLGMVIKNGGTVYLCSLCATFQNIEQDDLIDGVDIVQSIKIWDRVFEDGAKSMTF